MYLLLLDLISKRKYPKRYSLDGNYLTYRIGNHVNLNYDTRKIETETDSDSDEYTDLLHLIEWSCDMAARESGYPELLTIEELEALESSEYFATKDGIVICVNRELLQKQITKLDVNCTIEPKGRPVVVHFPTFDITIPEGTSHKHIKTLLLEAVSR